MGNRPTSDADGDSPIPQAQNRRRALSVFTGEMHLQRGTLPKVKVVRRYCLYEYILKAALLERQGDQNNSTPFAAPVFQQVWREKRHSLVTTDDIMKVLADLEKNNRYSVAIDAGRP